MSRARYLVVSPTLEAPLLLSGSVNEISFSTLVSTPKQQQMPKVTTVYPTVTSGTTSTSSALPPTPKRDAIALKKRLQNNSGTIRVTTQPTISAGGAGDNPIEQHISLDKILKSKLVSNDLSISDSLDDNLLEFYNTPMHFGTENSSMITVQAGAVAHLPCTVHQLGEGVVSVFSPLTFNLLLKFFCKLT